MAELIGNPNGTFQDRVRKLEPTDLAVPETWDPIHQTLITNDVILHGRVVALEDQVGELPGEPEPEGGEPRGRGPEPGRG
ncbi:hypothetical protein [Thermus antranikianii]|uniref:hypothetical protein n=1 Tax=Thermus antranikianii TaxID=88190 RepID=UPI001C75639E|nr:hypothetical protein [Thermus antranikianii]QWK20799.1 MAG: hypothetical protein KNN15_06915 [Thermus antranikianii]